MACGGAVIRGRPLLFLLLLLCELVCCELVEMREEASRGHAGKRDFAGMKAGRFGAAMLPLAANAVNVVVSNDDGWAVSNIRALYSALLDGGYDAIVSAPAINQSGTGSSDAEPEEVEDGCQFQSCPPGSPPTGSNASDPGLNYVNSFPATAMAYGIETLSEDLFSNGQADLALAGPNHGSNIDLVTRFSGTVGAAVEAASLGIPAVAFSGRTGDPVPWDEPTPKPSQVYADLALIVTNALTAGGKPYLPANTWLNVNFPAVDEECSQPADFKFVLTRLFSSIPLITPPDVDTCGLDGRLRSERTAFFTPGCYASISVGDLDKTDGNREKQAAVLERLDGILSCLP